MTKKICELRDKISNIWHKQGIFCDKICHGFASQDHYEAFCTAKDLIQDTAEALMVHREAGFAADPHLAYIEFWGVMQAITIQQDAISELNYAVFNEQLKHKELGGAWCQIRDWRNVTTGHPSRKVNGEKKPKRCVSGRETKTYRKIRLQMHSGQPMLENLNLGKELDAYEIQACQILVRQKEQLETLFE